MGMFDHEAEAWDQHCNDQYNEAVSDSDCRVQTCDNFEVNDLFYHTRKVFPNLIRETPKAYGFKRSDGKFLWIPKKIVKRYSIDAHNTVTCFVHTNTYKKILESRNG